MQNVVELNRRPEAEINYPCHRLPKDLHQTNAAEVAVPLWDQDGVMSYALLHKVTLSEGCLDQDNDNLPLLGVR